MKYDVVLVNIARGAGIDEAALVKALNSGKVAYVGFGVCGQEPSIHWN
jgi:D-3-phosphoglycerate dehydrogenase